MRTRRATEMQTQEYTPDGGTPRIVEVPIKVDVPIIRDWDAIALRSATSAVVVLVLGAMVWSTVSIGAMLSLVAPAWTSYMIAAIFDAAWIICLILEWLSRFNPEKVGVPRSMGWIALVISMAAIAVHGSMAGYLMIGLFGAVVSAIAKGLWAMVMYHTAHRLTPVQQAWVTGELTDLSATKAVIAARRSMARQKAQIALEAVALASTYPVPTPEVEQEPVVVVKVDNKKVKRLKRERDALRRELEESRRSPEPPVVAPPVSSVPVTSSSGGSGAPERPALKKTVVDLLVAGTDPKDVVDRVLELRPGTPPDSARRTLSTVLREGGYL